MYAVVETGGKQYKVALGDKLNVEKLDVAEGATVTLDRVLMVCTDGKVQVGEPLLKGTSVAATVLAQGRGEKIKVYKFKRRKKYRRTQGHRQAFTQLEITAIGDQKAEKATSKQATKKKSAAKVATKPAVKKVAPKKAATKTSKPTAKSSTDNADNLTNINGIGPVIEKKLHALGITTFKQIAEFTSKQVTEIDEQLNFKGRIEREAWISQAKDLAK